MHVTYNPFLIHFPILVPEIVYVRILGFGKGRGGGDM